MRALRIAALVLAVVVVGVACSSSDDDKDSDFFLGTWLNDSADGNIPQLVVRQEGGLILVHGYGNCTPDYCDWGEAATGVDDAEDDTIQVQWDFGWKLTTLALSRIDANHAMATVFDDYSAADGRTDRTYTETFHRQ